MLDSLQHEFRLDDTVKMLPADELFSEEKIIPLQLAPIRLAKGSPADVRSPVPINLWRMVEINGPDIYAFLPKAPRCSSLWKELLGLKKATEFVPIDQVDFEAEQRNYSAENGEDCEKERRTGGVLCAIVGAVQGKKPTEFASDGFDDKEAEENEVCLQEINNRSRLRFCREVKILKALSGHKNLIKFYDACEDALNVYIVVALCVGRELSDIILSRGGRYMEEEAKEIV